MENMTNLKATMCAVCGIKKDGHTDYCRTHKFAIRRAARRVRDESLTVEQAGGAWWVWDAKGEVLAIGEATRAKALAALDLGDEE